MSASENVTPSFKYTNDKKDPVAYLRAQDSMARENEIKIQTVLLMQDEIMQCYRKEGVNHYQNCRELTQKYRQMTQDGNLYAYKPTATDSE